MNEINLFDDEQYTNDCTELSVVKVLAKSNGDPVIYSFAATGPFLCHKLIAMFPEEKFASCEANNQIIGLAGLVSGEERCDKVFALLTTIQGVANHG